MRCSCEWLKGFAEAKASMERSAWHPQLPGLVMLQLMSTYHELWSFQRPPYAWLLFQELRRVGFRALVNLVWEKEKGSSEISVDPITNPFLNAAAPVISRCQSRSGARGPCPFSLPSLLDFDQLTRADRRQGSRSRGGGGASGMGVDVGVGASKARQATHSSTNMASVTRRGRVSERCGRGRETGLGEGRGASKGIKLRSNSSSSCSTEAQDRPSRHTGSFGMSMSDSRKRRGRVRAVCTMYVRLRLAACLQQLPASPSRCCKLRCVVRCAAALRCVGALCAPCAPRQAGP
ncbi:hypothetical protein EV126DRAFT_206863 [Verticillium dahliae]|nr:hypothetical protein EV126DRAFT_206863 [Verticillium dahliae]